MLPAGTYAVSEDVHSGYLLAGFSGDCDSSGIVTVVPGGSSTCTITNDDIAPKLTVTKIVVNDNPVKWFKPNHRLRIADREMNKIIGGTYM